MWTLFVISMVMGQEEPKFTRYGEYKTEWLCRNALDDLEKEFISNEDAVCLLVGKDEPRLDSLY